jgi:hypothetical protein
VENKQEVESRLASGWLSAGVFVMALRMAMGERLSGRRHNYTDVS